MTRLALNFICKNESHVILKMLDSARPITDLIVAVDTGSTDNTIELIQQFGLKHSIPTFVYTRAFDDFCNSRNYALDMLRQVVGQLEWPEQETFGFFIDCDEKMVISDQFSKEQIRDDMYLVSICGGDDSHFRQLFFRLSIKYRWEGPIHEMLVAEKKGGGPEVIEGIAVFYETIGSSWKGNLEMKFLERAQKLADFVENGNETARWIYYTADSYSSAAVYCPSKLRKKELRTLAKQYFEKALLSSTIHADEKIQLLFKLGEIKRKLGYDWREAQEAHLQAFEIDYKRAESIAAIVRYYMSQGQWEKAYLFIYFAKNAFHLNRQANLEASWRNESLYRWKLLFYHFVCCQQSGRRQEAKGLQKQIKQIIHEHPEYFAQKDLMVIQLNSPMNQAILNFPIQLRKKLKGLFRLK